MALYKFDTPPGGDPTGNHLVLRPIVKRPGGRASNDLDSTDPEGDEKQLDKGSMTEKVEGDEQRRLTLESFGRLSREIRGMIWRQAMADFMPLQFSVILRPLVDLTLARTDITRDEYNSYYCHFNWMSDNNAGGAPRSGTYREGNILLLEPYPKDRRNLEAVVLSRIRHNRDLMLACREAREEIERLLPDILPLSGLGAMRINATVDILWFLYADQMRQYDGMRRPPTPPVRPSPAPTRLPPRNARTEGRQLAEYDRGWNKLVHNIAERDLDIPILCGRPDNIFRVSEMALPCHFERFHEYPNLKNILVVWMTVLAPACRCHDCPECRQERMRPLIAETAKYIDESLDPGLPKVYTFHEERKQFRNYKCRVAAPDTDNQLCHPLSELLHSIQTVRQIEVGKDEPDAVIEVGDKSRRPWLWSFGLVHPVYHRYKWKQTPIVSALVAVDKTVKDIPGRDWVAERLRDSQMKPATRIMVLPA